MTGVPVQSRSCPGWRSTSIGLASPLRPDTDVVPIAVTTAIPAKSSTNDHGMPANPAAIEVPDLTAVAMTAAAVLISPNRIPVLV